MRIAMKQRDVALTLVATEAKGIIMEKYKKCKSLQKIGVPAISLPRAKRNEKEDFHVVWPSIYVSGIGRMNLKEIANREICGRFSMFQEKYASVDTLPREWYDKALAEEAIEVEWEFEECMDKPKLTARFIGEAEEKERISKKRKREFRKVYTEAVEQAQELWELTTRMNKVLDDAWTEVYLTADLTDLVGKLKSRLNEVK